METSNHNEILDSLLDNIQTEKSTSDQPDDSVGQTTSTADSFVVVTYRVYSRRWFVVLVVSLLNAANTAVWFTFSPIADLTAELYSVTLSDVNWLSLIFLVVFASLCVLSIWIIDTLGLRISILLASWLSALGSVLRVVSAIETIPNNPSFAILMTGQGLAAAAQPIAMIIPVKVAALWFGPNQRAIANTIGTLANPLGIMLTNFISPNFVHQDTSRIIWLVSDIFSLLDLSSLYLNARALLLFELLLLAVIPVLTAFLATFGVCHSTPPSPPSLSASVSSEPFFDGVKKIAKLPMFWLLCLCNGLALGSASATNTLIQEILCPRGYSDTFAGLCGALYIAPGLVVATLAGFIVDKYKIFEEMVKVSCCLYTLFYLIYVEIVRFSDLTVPIGVVISCTGIFLSTMIPSILELGIESTYPIASATSSGLLLIFGQVFGIAMVLFMPALTTDMPSDYEFSHINCNPGTNSTGPNQDYTNANLSLVGVLTLCTVVFVFFYRCDYRRLKAEKMLAARRILNVTQLLADAPTIQDVQPVYG